MQQDLRSKLIKRILSRNIQVDPRVFDLLDLGKGEDEIFNFLIGVFNENRSKGLSGNFLTLDMVKRKLHKEDYVFYKAPPFNLEVINDFQSYTKIDDVSIGYSMLLKDRIKRAAGYFTSRSDRPVVSINSLRRREEFHNKLNICGVVLERKFKKNDVVLLVEDFSGIIEIHVPYDVYFKSGEILLDECILLEVEKDDRTLISKRYYHLDVGELVENGCKDDIYAVFISDIGVGASDFDVDSWNRFVKWMNGNLGDIEIVRAIKLIVFLGNLIHASEDYSSNMRECYERFSELLAALPSEVNIILMPGENDATSYFLPQVPILRNFAKSLYDLKNVRMQGNPCYISVNSTKILLFHGQTLDSVRGQLRQSVSATGLMSMLLKSRNLVPSIGFSTPVVSSDKDVLFIDPVPNIFVCGHLDQKEVSFYKGVLLVSLPSWKKDRLVEGKSAVVNLRSFEVLWR